MCTAFACTRAPLNTCTHRQTRRERERDTHTERERERHKHTHTHMHTHTHTHKHTCTSTHKHAPESSNILRCLTRLKPAKGMQLHDLHIGLLRPWRLSCTTTPTPRTSSRWTTRSSPGIARQASTRGRIGRTKDIDGCKKFAWQFFQSDT